ncbi:hypothetical protein GCM10011349_25410 [Novosphingobium indicum]|uniref:4Fe-4S Wbl-type domain-containing protein n=1 Tax=Novosphingobium indicum TaxID=462949 RepID=A0ABQ2JQQ3_9SPHN|nr:hypothetical protein GCM10011349_25410 [Novosphingobium indicum]
MARDLLPAICLRAPSGNRSEWPRGGARPLRAKRTIGSEPCAYCFAFTECWRAAQW